jgi:hypothetical protein
MPSCKDIAELASQRLERSLTWRERLAMRLHLFICKACPRYVEQLEFLHRSLHRLHERTLAAQHDVTLSAEARAAIRKALKRTDSADS